MRKSLIGLIVAGLVATPAFAVDFSTSCLGLVPDARYDHLPKAVPAFVLVDDVTAACRQRLEISDAYPSIACEGWRGGVWYIVLDKHRSAADLNCDIRHEFAHQNEREAGVSHVQNAGHAGWRIRW